MLELTLPQARRFLLAQQYLLPPRSLNGREDALAVFERLGCIQFDPVNIVGWNPNLVLQARLGGYRADLLDKLLYEERALWDGWDKVASIYLARDWRHFARRREHMRREYAHSDRPAMRLAEPVMAAIRERGALSSLDIDNDERADWWWSETRLVRTTFETLYHIGDLAIHHRAGTRRYFDLTERLLPAGVERDDPHATLEDYHDWHVLRRVGSLGLAQNGSGEHWGGIYDMRSTQRQAALNRLLERGLIHEVRLEGITKRSFYLREADRHFLDAPLPEQPRAAFLAPLDNFLWDRARLAWIFGFEYVWEIYKRPEDVKYGHYVLPVLYGDRFVARFEPAWNRKSRCLTIKNWWWETGVEVDDALRAALNDCLREFCAYLGATEVIGEEKITRINHRGAEGTENKEEAI